MLREAFLNFPGRGVGGGGSPRPKKIKEMYETFGISRGMGFSETTQSIQSTLASSMSSSMNTSLKKNTTKESF